MATLPTRQTERLRLRPFTLADAPEVQRLAGDREVASTTQNIPHPYEDGVAERWINTHQEQFEKDVMVILAVERLADGQLMGAVSLAGIDRHDNRAELGYWIGRPFWGSGVATEASLAILHYGFVEMKLNRIFARHLTRNPASGRVMQKIGMTYEGCMRQHIRKWGVYEDIAIYGILREEYEEKDKE
jgi:[ribosomal protein S5]-alanine N-acetyltransferase